MEYNEVLVSVIIPVFNAENYIVASLQSILSQTHKNLEIVVIDDGSTDNTKSIISSYDDDRIVFRSRPNKGLISTLNECIDLSNGAFIARMDADDIAHLDRIKSQVNFLEKNTDTGVLFTGFEYIDADDKVFNKNVPTTDYMLESVELLFGCPVCHPTAMFDMRKLKKSDIYYNESYKNAEDFELWTRLIGITQVGILQGPLLQYRIHSGSITSQNNIKQNATAVRAIKSNLLTALPRATEDSIETVYNNTESRYSFTATFKALFLLFWFLKKLNPTFSRVKYVKKSVRLLKLKIELSSKKNVKLRQDL